MQRLYCYVDESGQDTQGALFVVGIVVTDRERDALCGLIRDAKDGNTWAQTMLHALQKKKAVTAL